MNSSENTKLYGMRNFFDEIISLYNKKKCRLKFYYLVKKA